MIGISPNLLLLLLEKWEWCQSIKIGLLTLAYLVPWLRKYSGTYISIINLCTHTHTHTHTQIYICLFIFMIKIKIKIELRGFKINRLHSSSWAILCGYRPIVSFIFLKKKVVSSIQNNVELTLNNIYTIMWPRPYLYKFFGCKK